LSQLSVFRGGCTRQAAQEVTGASLKVLAALANKSLLPYSKENGRYRIHELLRQYAAEKLARDPAREATTRDRHSAHYCALLQEQEAHLKGLQQQAALAAIQADIDNAMAAWHWAAEQGHVARLAQAIEGLGIFFEWRGRYQEGESTYRAAAEKMAAIKAQSPSAPADGLRLWARLLTWQSVYSGALGQSEPAREQLQRSLALLDTAELAGNDTRWEKAFARLQMGYNMVDSNPEAASRLAGQSLALYRALEDRWGSAQALVLLGESAWHLGDHEQSTQLNQESLALRQALGDQRGIADSLAALGRDSWPQGGSEEGERVLRESIAIRRQIGEQAGLAEGLTILGCSLSLLGKVAEAVSVLEEGMAIYKNLGNAEGLAASNSLLGMVETGLGRYKRSHAHLKTGLTIAREIGNEKRIGEALKDLAELALVEEAYQEALQLAQEVLIMGMAKSGYATLRASTVALQGFAYLGLADTRRARQCLQEALQIVTRIRSFIPLHEIIALSGLLLLNRGETERAIELFALWSRYPHVANSRWFEDVAGRHVAAAAATLPPEIVEAARARGQARDLWETVAELLAELEDTRAWQEG
jgi:tetratricopeptide (TPR) repeat protein